MKLITLMENTSCREDICYEHGLSLYLETDTCNILFDAGQSAAFAENANRLGVDLKKVDFAVLSHGHYDHSGGLGTFLTCNETAPVYVSQWAFEPHWESDGRYVGVDQQLKDNQRIRYVAEETKLGEGVTLYRLNRAPMDTAGLLVEEEGVRKPDDFRHEQYLLLEERGKRILISGCSHKGILNIMDAFRPDVLVGGFHFMKMEDEVFLARAAQQLLEYDTVYYTGHCTGQKQYDFLKNLMGDRLHYISAGTVLEI